MEYMEAKIVESVANIVRNRYGDYLSLGEAKIKYLFFSTKTSTKLGDCDRTTGKWKFLTNYDYVVLVWKEWWETANKRERRALIFHELKHVMALDEKYRTRRHDCELFADEIMLFGPWRPCIKQALEAFRIREERKRK